MLVTRMEEWKRRWVLEQEQRGEPRGEQTAAAAFLLRLLERRFGVLPDRARDRVLTADTLMIEEWSLRALDAASLDEVFA